MSTPICPACGAKFAHSGVTMSCSRCGLPDEIRDLGPKVIERWRKQQARDQGISKRERKRDKLLVGGSAGRRKKKHGRNV